MEPRIVIKSHTQSLRPGLFSLIITRCTALGREAYPEQVSKKAKDILRAEFKEEREAAAKFAVLAATKNFHFLQANMAWAWRGTAVNAILLRVGKGAYSAASDLFNLTPLENVLYLKYFMEADGAALCMFAQLIRECGIVTRKILYENVGEIFQRLYDSYVKLSHDYHQRVRIKERFAEMRKQLKGKGYAAGTVPHKTLPHIEALIDLGILSETISDGEKAYQSTQYRGSAAIDSLANLSVDLASLEALCVDGNLFSLVAQVYNMTVKSFSIDSDSNIFWGIIHDGYEKVKNPMTGLASIAALQDWTCAIGLTEKNILISPQKVGSLIDTQWKKDPSAVRFHVDYSGYKAYVVFAN